LNPSVTSAISTQNSSVYYSKLFSASYLFDNTIDESILSSPFSLTLLEPTTLTELNGAVFKHVKYLGLDNPGGICYMNSVLQQLFMHLPFRNCILNYKEHKILGRNLEKKDYIEKTYHQLRVLFAVLRVCLIYFILLLTVLIFFFFSSFLFFNFILFFFLLIKKENHNMKPAETKQFCKNFILRGNTPVNVCVFEDAHEFQTRLFEVVGVCRYN
jgi:hypothetical protein